MTKKQMRQATFREFLREHHSTIYQGVDDDSADGFEQWLETRSVDEMVELGEQYGVQLRG